eukprot:4036010-Amphidinium_carterae.1
MPCQHVCRVVEGFSWSCGASTGPAREMEQLGHSGCQDRAAKRPPPLCKGRELSCSLFGCFGFAGA